MNNTTNYWFVDLTEITNIEKYNKLVPSTEDEYSEKVNSLIRLSIVVGVFASLINLNYTLLFIPLIAMIVSFISYQYKKKVLEQEILLEKQRKNAEDDFLNIKAPEQIIISNDTIENLKKQLNESRCTPPTRDNVFMNALPYDDRQRYPACDYTEDQHTKSKIDAMFDIYPHDTQDIFNRNDGRYGFHTMPSTTFPNDRDTFATWAYGRPLSCKEGNGLQCYTNTYYQPETRMNVGNNNLN